MALTLTIVQDNNKIGVKKISWDCVNWMPLAQEKGL